jgi:hypothetical protein
MPAAPMEHKAAGIDRGSVSTRVRRWIYFFPAFSWIRRSTSRPASRPLLRMRAPPRSPYFSLRSCRLAAASSRR